MSSAAPVGVFDSGVGGLSVLAELRRAMPHEEYLYLADTAHVPIGARSDEEIRDLTDRAVSALHARGVKGVVVACNTASAFSLSHLRARFAIPIIGLVPAVKPAVEATRSGVVGVLATPGTLRGTLLADVIRQFADPAGVKVLQAVSRELVPLVEAGQADSSETQAVLREVLSPLVQAGADQLVLGCTHYPFLAGSIHAEFGNCFTLVDSGAAVARHTRRVLAAENLLTARTETGKVTYLVTGDVDAARPVFATLVSQNVHNEDHTPAAASTQAAPLRIEHIHT
ncbi:glutamate racemase [Deinococcus deserti]|uniref:Glutamate racemase n=1 Tax=Deinococcus deserti (strain DSM 17065 / CIP 109153 / LMG 22923 / VCD115) TaxID=546414 RepID=C1CZI9_DEIDV|nr:glutamate racemase [Deinococcus deserti]ACO47237.1 putative glutamate racemase [Deinococcus deserti VCD115]